MVDQTLFQSPATGQLDRPPGGDLPLPGDHYPDRSLSRKYSKSAGLLAFFPCLHLIWLHASVSPPPGSSTVPSPHRSFHTSLNTALHTTFHPPSQPLHIALCLGIIAWASRCCRGGILSLSVGKKKREGCVSMAVSFSHVHMVHKGGGVVGLWGSRTGQMPWE